MSRSIKRILLIDPNKERCGERAYVLHIAGWRVVLAYTVPSAIRFYAETPTDLVIVTELRAKAFRRAFPESRILALQVDSEADRWLPKYEATVVIDTIKTMLARRPSRKLAAADHSTPHVTLINSGEIAVPASGPYAGAK